MHEPACLREAASLTIKTKQQMQLAWAIQHTTGTSSNIHSKTQHMLQRKQKWQRQQQALPPQLQRAQRQGVGVHAQLQRVGAQASARSQAKAPGSTHAVQLVGRCMVCRPQQQQLLSYVSQTDTPIHVSCSGSSGSMTCRSSRSISTRSSYNICTEFKQQGRLSRKSRPPLLLLLLLLSSGMGQRGTWAQEGHQQQLVLQQLVGTRSASRRPSSRGGPGSTSGSSRLADWAAWLPLLGGRV
jgi:hypothetical protein